MHSVLLIYVSTIIYQAQCDIFYHEKREMVYALTVTVFCGAVRIACSIGPAATKF